MEIDFNLLNLHLFFCVSASIQSLVCLARRINECLHAGVCLFLIWLIRVNVPQKPKCMYVVLHIY